MDVPQVRYATTVDGVHIAYQVVGDGPIDLVYLPENSLALDGRWHEPIVAQPLRRLASFTRLISMDKRGIGCSDPAMPDEVTAVEEWTADIEVVMDHVGSPRAAIMAVNDGGGAGLLFAATHPDRTSALILANTAARWLRDVDYPWGMPTEAYEHLIEGVVEDWETGRTIDVVAPSIAGNERLRRWYMEGRRHQASPATIRALYQSWRHWDGRRILPLIRCPTIVLHASGALVGHGRYLADHIAGARFVEIPGDDMLWWAGSADRFVDEIQTFLTGVRPAPEADRVLATILFTDIVDSTAAAAERGDHAWRDVLDAHDAIVRRELERHRGRQVKTTGDGVLATFDGPARAVRSAQAIRDALTGLGIQIRAGLHAGEVELRGEDVSGLAVALGQRVSALAAPGEILVSSTVKELAAGSGIRFEDRGLHTFKGIPESWRIFAAP